MIRSSKKNIYRNKNPYKHSSQTINDFNRELSTNDENVFKLMEGKEEVEKKLLWNELIK
jgi:hypothetical protein